MVWRFMTPLKVAPVWNVLITSICKESESETALLHSQREEKGRTGRQGDGGLGKGMESNRESPSHTQWGGDGRER
jgi:hypothetical protein